MMKLQVVRRFTGLCVLLFLGTVLSVDHSAWSADRSEESAKRLLEDVKFLADDAREGRGVGTSGLDQAADYIRDEFAKAGLKVDSVDNGAFQPFTMTTGAKMGATNTLTLQGPDSQKLELKLGEDFSPQSFGESGKFTGELVFCGYGIEAEDKKYNDFQGLQLQGKVLIIMRREPRSGRPDGLGDGHGGMSPHSDLRSKIGHAATYGAAAVIFVDDPASARNDLKRREESLAKQATLVADAALKRENTPNDAQDAVKTADNELKQAVGRYKELKDSVAAGENDDLMKFGYAGHEAVRPLPILHMKRAVADKILATALKTNLSDIEKEIDDSFKPHSAVLPGWTAVGEVEVERTKATVKNVIGVLEGEGPLADETIVIGAHYDHVGRGQSGSLSPGSNEIHNGADDNASGTSSLLELARRLGHREHKLPRRLVFIAFTAEESGLIGSAEYCKAPVFPLEKTVAMFNMDMVGRLSEDKLTVFGTGTAPTWTELLNKFSEPLGFKMTFQPEGFGPSDHSSFYAKKIPVLHFFTGTHSDYHRPGDDWDKINSDGIRRVTDLVEELVVATAETTDRPDYVEVKGSANVGRAGSRPYFGSIPDFGNDKPGLALTGVSGGSPAEKGGLKAGDRIVQLGTHKIANLEDFDLALRKFAPGDEVEVTVMREEKPVKLKVKLDKPR